MRVLLLCIVILVAGCSDAPPVETEDEGFLEAPPTETTGAITGVVVNTNIEPIAGAEVRISNTPLNATTDAQGRFSFRDLDPGTWFLEASAARHAEVQVSAQVEAGKTTKVRIAMEHDGRPDPFHTTHHFQGAITFHATVAWAVVEWELHTRYNISTPACERCVYIFNSDGTPEGHLFEAVWQDNIQDPRGPSELYWSYAVREPYQELFGYEASPIYKPYGKDAFKELGEYEIMLLGDADGVQIDQDFEIFLTQFFHAGVPDGWSIVQDDV